MSSNVTGIRPATELLQLDTRLLAADRYLRDLGQRVVYWFEERRSSAAALSALEAMSERELRDIGLSRGDVRNAAAGGSPRATDDLSS